MTGRPSLYTGEIAEEICARISAGETLKQICRDEHIPPESTVRTWVREDREGFSARYACARELQIDCWADDIIELADDGRNDWIKREKEAGRITLEYNGDNVQRSRLRIDTRKWLLSKLKPERYGESLKLSGSLDLSQKTEAQLEAELARLLAKAGGDPAVGETGNEEEAPGTS